MKSRITTVMVVALGLIVFNGALQAEEAGEQKAVLVTGANSGIGLKITEVLSANGYYVYGGARKEADLERLNAMDNVSAVRLDVTIQEDIDAAVKFVNDEGRGLWGIVNNAGLAIVSSIASGADDAVQYTMDVNVLGPFRINKAFLPPVIESGGRTTTIGSISGFIAGRGSYSMSKFAVEAYTDSLARELSDSGVHVSIVEPGGYKSGFRDALLERAEADAAAGSIELTDELRQQLQQVADSNAAMKEPDEVADAVLDLMTSDTPKRRYMVTPNKDQADRTIGAALQRLIELNQDHAYSLSRDELVAMLDELLAGDTATE